MAEETNLTVQILREIQATQAEHTRMLTAHMAEFASIKEIQRAHGIRLDANTENFEDVRTWMREIHGLLKDYAVAQELRKTMRDLTKRVQSLESTRQ